VDAEINDMINAIRKKDPRLYDSSAKFFKELDASTEMKAAPKEKAMTLKDYHRKNLLASANGTHDEDEEDQPRTYAQEQAAAKSDFVKALLDAADKDGVNGEDESDEDDDSFLQAKSKPAPQTVTASKALPDPTTAEKDPETFLSNFFAARAWVPTANSRFAHLESDDEEADQRAEDFETAYNLRFEDPATSNTTLKTHARDVIAEISVRRDETMNPRKRAREKAKAEKEARKAEEEVERARLRKLKIEEMEDKLEKIRYAAGEQDVDIADWAGVLQEDWDDARFDEEMRKRFGDEYYEKDDQDVAASGDDDAEDESDKKSKKGKKGAPEKPTWDDDIDIKDLVSDFEEDEGAVSLSEDEDNTQPTDDANEDENDASLPAKRQKKSKTASKRDRRLIESLASQSLSVSLPPSKTTGPRFAYRETSPSSFGLSALDILAADDAQLNEWAGLKKLATFRDEGKKEKDRRRLGKKGRLREWRKETFGSKEGPSVRDWYVEGAEVPREEKGKTGGEDGVDVVEGKRKKRRRGKKNKGDVEV
jgi:protein KRI1